MVLRHTGHSRSSWTPPPDPIPVLLPLPRLQAGPFPRVEQKLGGRGGLWRSGRGGWGSGLGGTWSVVEAGGELEVDGGGVEAAGVLEKEERVSEGGGPGKDEKSPSDRLSTLCVSSST